MAKTPVHFSETAMHRTFILVLAMLLLMPAAIQADIGDFAGKVVNKVENAATKAGEGIERAGSGVQRGASNLGDKTDAALKPVRDKLAQNDYELTRHSDLRASPGSRARVHGTFKAGAKVVVDDWSDDKLWGHVRIRHEGRVHDGWVPRASLKKID
jgi:hypothetical protein